MLKGFKHSQKTKDKISRSKTGVKIGPQSAESNEKRRIAMTGRKLTKAHRLKLRLAKLGKKRWPHTEETKEKIRTSQLGPLANNWKSGKYITPRGYIHIHCKNHPQANKRGYVCEHRLVMEKHIGRYLRKDEVVHHINEVTTDNRIENLKIMTQSEHSRYHHLGKRKNFHNLSPRN